MKRLLPLSLLLSLSCATTPAKPATAVPRALKLPGAPAEGVGLDYLAYDPVRHRVWIPAGNTARVDVVDTRTDKLEEITGFATREVERNGKKRTVGPSAAAVANDMVFIGNRGDSSVCAFDAATLDKKGCLALASTPDALLWIASRKELWVTTPRAKGISVIDAANPAALRLATQLTFEGEPEGFSADEGHGRVFTNLEDKDRTLTIDLANRRTVNDWPSGCGEDGPKGLLIDPALGFLVVACPASLEVFDAVHGGAPLSTLDVGAGVDSFDYLASSHTLYVGAARAASLIVARLDPQGHLTAISRTPTVPGARNPVVTEDGTAYLTDSSEGSVLVVPPAPIPESP
jgi:DNA-binding beta-propeller fold protein YncE